MTGAEVFSYALLLKGADRIDQILALLEAGRREEVKTVLEQLRAIPPDAIRLLWRERRAAEDSVLPAGA